MKGAKVQQIVLFCFGVCGLFLLGCRPDSGEEKIERKQKVWYRASMRELPPELRPHFPKEIPPNAQDAYFFGVHHDSIHGYKFQAILAYTEEEYHKRVDSLREHVLVRYQSDPGSIMRINTRFSYPNGLPEEGSGKRTPPVPAHFIGRTFSKGLGQQFELLVLHAQPYGPSNTWQATFEGGVASDSLWQSGIAYGVLLDSAQNSILYWTEQW